MVHANGRILYLAPDLAYPSGGVNAIYSHVACLRDNGYAASVVHIIAKNAYPFAAVQVPVLAFDTGLILSPADVLVVPEGMLLPEMTRMPRVKKIAFVQSCLIAYSHPAGHAAWREIGFHGALCCSALTTRFAVGTLGMQRTWTVPNAIDPVSFRPREKKLQIAFMPRKNSGELEFLRASFLLRNPACEAIPWVALDGMPLAEVGRILGESAIFLSTCHYEGFHLPALEAMSCGAVVVGFHGYGGLEYTHDGNGLWCPQGDLLTCLDQLERAVSLVEADGDELAALVGAALETAGRYRRPSRDRALLAAWREIMR